MRVIGMLCAIALLGTLTACGGARSSHICKDLKPDTTISGDPAALAAEGDKSWPKRGIESELRKTIQAWEKSLRLKPNQPDLRVRLARAHYLLADGHLRFDEDLSEQMATHFEKGANHAELALGQKYPEYRSKYCARRPTKVVLQTLDKGAVPAMYWFSTNLGKYGLEKSLVVVLNEKDRIKAMMDLIEELYPDYFFAGVYRYLGSYFTKIPFPGGDLPKARTKFEKSLALAPNYIGTNVLFADLYAIKAKDKALFKRLLETVLNADANVVPELAPEAGIEKRKAKELMDEIDVYFPED